MIVSNGNSLCTPTVPTADSFDGKFNPDKAYSVGCIFIVKVAPAMVTNRRRLEMRYNSILLNKGLRALLYWFKNPHV